MDAQVSTDAYEIFDSGVEADSGIDGGEPEDAGSPDAEIEDAGHPDGAADAAPDAAAPDGGIGFAHWANTQWPPHLTLAPGGRAPVYGQIWIEGETERAGATSGLDGELGLGPAGSDPTGNLWSWTAASYNVDAGNNDELMAELVAPAGGAFDYAFRYRFDGSPWIYADRSGTGDGYRTDDAGKLAVREPGAILRIATLNLQCLSNDPIARLDAAAVRFAALGTDIIALQEVCAGAPVTNSAEYLAQQLTAATGRTWRYAFEQTHLFNNSIPEGIGIVTALPLAELTVHPLPVADFPRKTIIAVAASPIGIVAFATVHFSFRVQDAQARLDQAREVVARLSQLDVAAAIVAGDFNATPDQPPPAELISASFVDAFTAANPGENGFTHSSSNPTRRIDYLFARPHARWPLEVTGAAVEFAQPYAAGSYVSDHRGVSAEITAR